MSDLFPGSINRNDTNSGPEMTPILAHQLTGDLRSFISAGSGDSRRAEFPVEETGEREVGFRSTFGHDGRVSSAIPLDNLGELGGEFTAWHDLAAASRSSGVEGLSIDVGTERDDRRVGSGGLLV